MNRFFPVRYFRCALAAALATLVASCGYPSIGGGGGSTGTQYLMGFNTDTPTPEALPFANDDVSYWDGDQASGSPLIRINRAQQKAFFYKGGELVAVSKIASGKEGHTTPPGSYKVIQKVPNYVSGTYGIIRRKATGETVNPDATARVTPIPPGCEFVGAPMPYFMRFHAGYGMHEGFLPGYPASKGCIRMPPQMIRHFYNAAPLGTPVIVE